MQDAKEEVRARLNIEDVIGEYVQLKRAGRSYKGLSPFSGEKTPSFYVSPDKNIWHDFSSNKGGDVFAFVMEAEGMDFRQALEHLARKAGVELSDYESAGAKQLAARKRRLLDANQLAARYYQQTLVRNHHAREYVVNKRHLDGPTIGEFQIGYSPDEGSALVTALAKKGFSKTELADAGLVNRFGGDLYRGRMMIPLMDGTGQVIGFTGRLIDDVPNAPKYLNTPQTLLYDKSRHVFGLSQAKEAIRSAEFVVVVEGNLDVVSSHRAGVKQVVATAGTAMTEQHLRGLKRLTSDVRLAYDGDKAGVAATERAIAVAANVGIDLAIIRMPEGAKDPDELIQTDVAAWRQAIETTQPAVEWILEQYQSRVDMATAKGKREFTSAALVVVRQLPDPVEREHYERLIAQMTKSSLDSVHAKLTNDTPDPTPLREVKAIPVAPTEDAFAAQDNALAIALIDANTQELIGQVNDAYWHGEERQTLARYVVAHAGTAVVDVPEELQKFDTYVKIVLLRADARYASMDTNDRYYEIARLLRQIEHEHKKQTRDELVAELRQAEEGGDETAAERLRIELNNLIKEIARGKR
ncbi:MAG: DNA primase [Candidatus Saccharimonas sp.]